VRKEPSEQKPVDLNGLVRESVGVVEGEARQLGIQLHLDLAPDLRPVVCNGVQIEQVILNLLRNALEAVQANAHGEGPSPSPAQTRDTTRWRCRCATTGSVCPIRLPTCSPRSTARSRSASGWGCRSAAPSSRRTTVTCAPCETRTGAARFPSRCRSG